MGVVIPETFYQAVFRWSLSGDPEEMVSTLGFDYTGAGTVEDVASDVYNMATATGSITESAAILTDWTFVGTTVYLQGPAGLVVGIHNDPIGGVGGGAFSPPNNCAVLVQKRTAIAGQRHRGRFFLPPFTTVEGGITPTGTYTTTEYSAINARVQEFFVQCNSGDYTPVLLHSDGGTPTPITAYVLDTQIATQRRRMRS